LNQLKLVEGLSRETRRERVTVLNTRGDEAMDKDGRSMGGDRGAESVYIL